MPVLLLILVALCLYGIWEYHGHQQRVSRIPLRIHVNGTRGKSSVTRLVAAGLRAGGIKTMAKTTGTLPRIIDFEGKEVPIIRYERANIIEQIKIFRYFSKRNPQAIVIECMAVLPEYQWLCEHKLVHAHVGVITNARLDHINEMGHFREQIARSLSNTVPEKKIFGASFPVNGVVKPPVMFTSEQTNFKVMKEVADKEQVQIFQHPGDTVSREELQKFGYIEHPANVDLALAVCSWVGVDRQVALDGMYRTAPDAGALKLARCHEGGKEILFINAMAANDPESTLEIYHQISERFAPLGTIIVMLNSRSDRQDRSMQLLEMAGQGMKFDRIVLTGESMEKFTGMLPKYGIKKELAVGIGWVSPEKAYHKLFELIPDRGTVFAMGNVGAGGLDIFRHFYKHRRQGA